MSGFGQSQSIKRLDDIRLLTGVYDVQTVHVRARSIYTNTPQVDACRGAGRPEAIHTLERTMDAVTCEPGVEHVRSVNNPPGMKDCGEAGTVGALAVDMPLTPSRVWLWLKAAGEVCAAS